MNQIPKILLIEDSIADQEIFKRTIQDNNLSWKMKIFDSGIQAMHYLHNTFNHNDQTQFYTLPDLIILDINVPVMDGWQVLKAVRHNLKLKHIPIVIFTTSSRESDIVNSYRLGANVYITKANNEQSYINLILMLDSFWFKLARIPDRRWISNQ